METITYANREQLACIGILVNKLNLQASKKDLVAGFSTGRCESSKFLTIQEAAEMIKYLKSQDPDEKKAEVMRRKIISMAHQVGYRYPGTERVNMAALDGWCVKFGRFHKKLNACNLTELPHLVTQFQIYYAKELDSL